MSFLRDRRVVFGDGRRVRFDSWWRLFDADLSPSVSAVVSLLPISGGRRLFFGTEVFRLVAAAVSASALGGGCRVFFEANVRCGPLRRGRFLLTVLSSRELL